MQADFGAREKALTEPAAEQQADGRQFVTFVVAGRSYGVEIAAVREIIRWTRVTPLPNQPLHARGVLNLRGTIVPVHDLRAKLSGEQTQASENHVIVITWIGSQTIGLLVDAVSDILTVSADSLRPPPSATATDLIAALVSTDADRIVTILNLTALFGRVPDAFS